MSSVMKAARYFVMAVAVILSAYHLYTSVFGIPESTIHRMFHLLCALVLSFGTYNYKAEPNKGRISAIDFLYFAAIFGTLGYLILSYNEIAERYMFVTPLTTPQMVASVSLIVILLEATRRLTGWTLPIASALFFLYALFGQHMPDLLAHPGFELETVIEQIVLTSEGVFGSSLGITATYVVMFIILAAFMEVTGAGQFFIDLASSVAGATRGGPAKIAVVASCLFGSISGSSVANVVSTGTFTIPLIKKVGHPAAFAGAVEAVASTGGQIMPPVMAAVAFIMADFLGVPYLAICKAALIPALLYYISVFMMVDAKAVRMGIKGLPKESLPSTRKVLTTGWYLGLPFVVLIVMMMVGYSPMISGFYAWASLMAIMFIADRSKLTPRNILKGLEKGAYSVISVSVTSASAGILVGIIMLTGLGLKFTSLILYASDGNMFLAMFFAAIVSIILGMGLPTIPAYIVMSALVAPALIEMGAVPIAAHMFVLYYAVLSCITPPVAIASFAAAAIAGANAMKVGWVSVRLACVSYIIPFLFLPNPVLLWQGPLPEVLWSFASACIGILALTWAMEGVISRAIPLWQRGLLLLAAAATIYPEVISDFVGIALITLVFFLHRRENLRVQLSES